MIERYCKNRPATVQGDHTGRELAYYYVEPRSQEIVVSSDWNELLQTCIASGMDPVVDHESVSFLLHHSFIPVGRSIFKGIASLGIGDSIHVAGGGAPIVLKEEFPYFTALSTEKSQPSTRVLLNKLSEAVARSFKPSAPNWLMLSSGKDSASLALAYANAGLNDLVCLTFDNATGGNESEYAAALCKRLGLRHEIRTIPEDEGLVRGVLLEYFESTPIPCLDHVQLAYLLSLSSAGRATAGVVADGMGSDVFLGHVPTPRMASKERTIRPSLGAMRRLFPFTSSADRLFQPRSELHFPSPLLRHIDTRKFYDGSCDTHRALLTTERRFSAYDGVDYRTYIRGKHIDTGPAMQKGRNAAGFIGAQVAFPWTDADVIEYCFNLPEQYRFDRAHFRNKVLVRQMLHEYCDYDERKLPKRGFEFDGAEFVRRNEDFIRNEILDCELWNRSMESALDELLVQMNEHEKVNYPILMLFMISGWHNHYYRALRRGAARPRQ